MIVVITVVVIVIMARFGGSGGLVLPVDVAFQNRAGGRVDFVFVFRAALAEFNFVFAHAVVLFQLGLGEGHVAGGQSRVFQGDGLGLIHADGLGAAGAAAGGFPPLHALFHNRAGGRVDFVFIFRVAGDEFDFVHPFSVFPVQLGFGEGHISGGKPRVGERDAPGAFPGHGLSGFFPGGALAGPLGFVFGEIFDAHAAHRAGNRVDFVLIFRPGGAEGNFVYLQQVVRVQSGFHHGYALGSEPRVRQRPVQRRVFTDGFAAGALESGHFQGLFRSKFPGALDNGSVLGRHPVFVFEAVAAEFHVVNAAPVLGFRFGSQKRRLFPGNARLRQREIFRGSRVHSPGSGSPRRPNQRQHKAQGQHPGEKSLFRLVHSIVASLVGVVL